MTQPRKALALSAALLAIGIMGHALWIPAKAGLGQELLERAWTRQQLQQTAVKPWPWADTSPVGVLEIPRLGLRQLVLEGSSDRNLAWGPTVLGKLSVQDPIVSGHRDTHFRQLADLVPGDRLLLTDRHSIRSYRVAWLDIVDSRRQELVFASGQRRLTLVTCYPFEAQQAGGPLRLVVTALPEQTATDYSPARASHRDTLSVTTR